ncbi:nucleotide sugar dehydrogenase [Heliorestis acidaminivorans]|uniref:Nucleotide sugar dehydrogenase n=1 Tax=Heliorestis acidaminivorans TaxID=553427 RepID=A0A6I0F1F7_9FIRM|nr:nucleotide sugar dehydrogenase [Heliorestis acidaminivorans]KAB2953761.1 nucleotide sugar dehydrogenase [Heliorestis acidaminivorans]
MQLTLLDFKNKKNKIAIVGLGYVGLPLAVHLSHHFKVIGLDISAQRVNELQINHDRTDEVTTVELANTQIDYTTEAEKLKEAKLIIATVPTPINEHNMPDLTPVQKASEMIGRNLTPGSIVVYESTVYPGVTEEICVPILEKHSGLKWGQDFKVGYSPERINPGDREHALPKIVKVVAGEDQETSELLASIYGTVITAGIHVAPSIKTAEAAKVIENIQRDLNIALMNELALIFNEMNIDTRAVLEAAGTKWNFLRFEPGLVGGHCIGVDPYYLTFKAESIGYHPQVILSGRRINDQMGKYIAEQTVKRLINAEKQVKGARVLILGLTFKENVRDIRNTKVIDIYEELQEYGINAFVFDPLVDHEEAKEEYNIELLTDIEKEKSYDAVIIAVKHKEFQEKGLAWLRKASNGSPVLIDVKGLYNKETAEEAGFSYWRL